MVTGTADPQWYKDAIIYELHVRAFCDSDGDGIGDFNGLTNKLDYLQDLGVTAIWLLPFFPSPLRDDGYDIADYLTVHPDYGTLRDFRRFVQQAHARGIRVIAELVLNHTSNGHAWFKRARTAKPGSNARNFYVWSATPDKYSDARIIFRDFEESNWSWDPVAGAYYWHRFFSHQPDLNYENPNVRKAILDIIDFWFDLGIDGLRLDAVPYLFEEEGTTCENLPATHAFLKQIRKHVDARHKDRMLLAEANQWPEDAVGYFGAGDECHMAFHFPLMPRLFLAVQMESSFPIIDILKTTPPIPDPCQWAMFLRNHDELTLEMVTDEERDYMNRVFAHDPRMRINAGIRRRLAPLLGNNRKKIELMNILLFSFPGTPILYYGDELGMGDNYYLGDRNGVRTPMQWSADKNAGFSGANPQKLYLPVIIDPQYHYEAINVENQHENLSSMLWWMRRVIAVRRQYPCFSRGGMRFVVSDNPKVFSFLRTLDEEIVLVVANLSRFMQAVSLELQDFAGYVPQELFSRNPLPVIRRQPYVLTLGPHGHYWLRLNPKRRAGLLRRRGIAGMTVSGDWRHVLDGTGFKELKNILPGYLKTCRWYGSKTRTIRDIRIVENVPIGDACLIIVDIRYRAGEGERYLLPLAFAEGHGGERLRDEDPQAVVCRLDVDGREGVLYDGLYGGSLRERLFSLVGKRTKCRGRYGEILGVQGKKFMTITCDTTAEGQTRLLGTSETGTSIRCGDALFMKVYRVLENGANPGVQMIRYLSEKRSFPNSPGFAGFIEYRDRQNDSEPFQLCVLQEFIPNTGNGWKYTGSVLREFFERILAARYEPPRETDLNLMRAESVPVRDAVYMLLDAGFPGMIETLGKRTAQMHLALASGSGIDGFTPEPFSLLYQRSMFQSMQSLVDRTMQVLRNSLGTLPAAIRGDAEAVVSLEPRIVETMRGVTRRKIQALKIRTHGNFHLDQILHTGNDVVIVNFEGEPRRPMPERRLHYSALRDVAGMIRSFHYAGYAALMSEESQRPDDRRLLEHWIAAWYRYSARTFLQAYFEAIGDSAVVPRHFEDRAVLLRAFLLEKAIYELRYEIITRPAWTAIPVKGILEIMETVTDRKKGEQTV